MREYLDESIKRIDVELVLMAGMVENSILQALEALKKLDTSLAEVVIKNDDIIDEKELRIEKDCIDVIRRQAPIAIDLRRLISILDIGHELERIGDYAEGIAKLVIKMSGQKLIKELDDIPKMTKVALEMLKVAMDMFHSPDPAKLKSQFEKLNERDEKVDQLYERVVAELLGIMKGSSDNVEQGTYLLWVTHNLERIADRSVNIAERAYYQTTGVLPTFS